MQRLLRWRPLPTLRASQVPRIKISVGVKREAGVIPALPPQR